MNLIYSSDKLCPFLGGDPCNATRCPKWDELLMAQPANNKSSFGKCTAVAYKEDRRKNTDDAAKRIKAYRAGFTDGLSAYTVTKDKKKCVAGGKVTLDEAIINIEQIHNFSPRVGE